MAVTDEVILQIKRMIMSGELGPGDRLPPEKKLSERLGLSRSSMREAIKALEVIRVLDVRQGDGTYVTSLEPRLLVEAITFVVDMHTDNSMLELFAVRRICEGAAAGMAAGRISDEELTALRKLVDRDVAIGSTEELVENDFDFHAQIVQISGKFSSLCPSGVTVKQDGSSESLARADAVECGVSDVRGASCDCGCARRQRWTTGAVARGGTYRRGRAMVA